MGWSEVALVQKANGMLTICGNRPSNIYAGGRNGDILYYNGVKWNYDCLRIKPESGGEYYIRASAFYNDTTFFTGSMYGTTKNVFYQIKGTYNNWKIIDSMTINNPLSQYKFGDWDLYVSPSNRLFTFGATGIWEYKNNGYVRLLSVPYTVNGLHALNDNYILAVGDRGYVYFYDGSNWEQIQKFMSGYEDVLYQAVWGDGKELFIVGYQALSYPQKTIIWHGK